MLSGLRDWLQSRPETAEDRTAALQHKVQMGREAVELIKNAALRRAFDDVHSKLLHDMGSADLTNAALHTSLIVALQQLALVRGAIEAAIRDGEMAQSRLKEMAVGRPRGYKPPPG